MGDRFFTDNEVSELLFWAFSTHESDIRAGELTHVEVCSDDGPQAPMSVEGWAVISGQVSL